MKKEINIPRWKDLADGMNRPPLIERYILEQLRDAPPLPPGYHYEATEPVLKKADKTWTWEVTLMAKRNKQ